MRRFALALQLDIGAAQRRCEQEFGQGAFAHGLARPLLGRDDYRARLAVAGDGLGAGLGTINHLGEPGLGAPPAVSQVGAPLAAILQSARTMQQIMTANVLERRLRINLKCLHQHTAIAALAHGT